MKLLDFFFAGRPLLHLPVWSIYLVSLEYHLRLSGEVFGWSDLGMMACLSAAAAGTYYLNQVYDRESDLLNRKLGFVQRDLLTAQQLQVAFVVLSAVSLVGSLLYSWQMGLVFGQLILLGYIYSVPPLRLKDRAFWGLFANAYGFGFLIVFTVMPDITSHSAGLLGWDNPFYFLAAVAGIYALTTVPDAEGDRKTGKRTVAVVFGLRPSLALALLFMLVSVYVGFRSNHALLMNLAIVSSVPVAGALVYPHPRAVLFAAKLPILFLTLLAGYFFPVYLVFIVALVLATRIYYQRRFAVIYPQLA